MAARVLTQEQRDDFLSAITYRTTNFPRDSIRHKLRTADQLYHLAKMESTRDNSDGSTSGDGRDTNDRRNSDQDYSRYEELQNALVREICETYYANYLQTFVGKSQVFAMTSTSDRQEDAIKFNAVLGDQAKRNSWVANLSKFLLDVAKYNIGATDTFWDTIKYHTLARDNTATDNTNNRLKRTAQHWGGNAIKRLDMYNTLFDTSVDPEKLSKEGEWGGYLETYTQVRLKELIDKLNEDPNATAYTTKTDDPNFNIYKVQGDMQTNDGNSSHNLSYYFPDTIAYGQKESHVTRGGMDWNKHLGRSIGKRPNDDVQHNYYVVGKFYIKLVPSAYGLKEAEGSDDIEIWEVWLLEGRHILGTKRLDNAHQCLPMDLAVTDSDSLSYNSSGPTQVAIPYAKTAKQMTDRILAGADRAISDRGIVDTDYINYDDVNSRYPDAKMKLKKKLPNGKGISDVYYSIPFDNNATRALNTDKESIENAGRRAAGSNPAQAGQFVPGNKTLYEFQETMNGADDKAFTRGLFLENTYFQSIKTKLKINIIQYQQQATLFDPEKKEDIDIDPLELFEASVDFKLVDGLMPSEHMISPNVQQVLFTMFAQVPEAFAEYNVADMVSHILGQSYGFNLDQYKQQNPNEQT